MSGPQIILFVTLYIAYGVYCAWRIDNPKPKKDYSDLTETVITGAVGIVSVAVQLAIVFGIFMLIAAIVF